MRFSTIYGPKLSIKLYFLPERDFEDDKEEDNASGSKKEDIVIPDSTLEPEIQVNSSTWQAWTGCDTA